MLSKETIICIFTFISSFFPNSSHLSLYKHPDWHISLFHDSNAQLSKHHKTCILFLQVLFVKNSTIAKTAKKEEERNTQTTTDVYIDDAEFFFFFLFYIIDVTWVIKKKCSCNNMLHLTIIVIKSIAYTV